MPLARNTGRWVIVARKGEIDGFDPVLLDAHGEDLNGFFLIKGDRRKLDALVARPSGLPT